MSTNSKPLITAKYASNSQTSEYTTPTQTRTIIDKFTAYNGTGGSVTLTINLLPNAVSAAATNVVMSKAIPTLEAYTFPEVSGHTLEAGGIISVIASAATSIVIRATGREVS